MKILHYIPSIDRTSGGVGAYMQLLTTELGKLVELHVVTHCEANPLTLENCTIHYIPKNNNPFSNKGKTEFLTLLNDIKPDVFHANSCWLPLSAHTTIWAKNIGYTVVYTPHGMLEPWIMKRHYWTKKFPASLLFQKRGIQIANVIHATAESEKHNLTQLGWNNLEAISITFPVFFTRPGALLRIRPPKRLLLMVFSPLMVILPMTFFTRTPKVPYTF